MLLIIVIVVLAKWTKAAIEPAHAEDDHEEVPDNHSDNDMGCDTSRTAKDSLRFEGECLGISS